MWVSQSFLQVLFFIACTRGHPRKELSAPPEDHQKNETDAPRKLQAEVVHKPRIMVSYENVYKPNQPFATPNDPFQNILLYFLMNLGRDIAQSQADEGKARRSPDFFGDVRTGFTDVTEKVVNGTRDVGKKIEETAWKTLVPRGVDDQYEPGHYFPHVGGSCMCFNRLLRRGSFIATTNGQDFAKHDLATLGRVTKFQTTTDGEPSTEKRTDDDAKAMRDANLNTDATNNVKTTDLKTENHNVPGSDEKSTISVEDASANKTIIRVVNLDDFKSSPKLEETTTKLATEKKEVVISGEEIIVDLLAPEEQCKRKQTKELVPPVPPLRENVAQKKAANNEDGYYFLSSSGGTDKRTTAPNNSKHDLILYNFEGHLNDIPIDEEQPMSLQKRIREARRRRKRVRRHHDRHNSPNKEKATLHLLQQEIRKRHTQLLNHQANKTASVEVVTAVTAESLDADVKKSDELMLSNFFDMPDETGLGNDLNGVTNLKSVEDIIKYHNWAPKDSPQQTQEGLLLTVTLPTFIGAALLLLVLCYVLRTRGWCCKLFTDKSRIVVLEVKNTSKQANKDDNDE